MSADETSNAYPFCKNPLHRHCPSVGLETSDNAINHGSTQPPPVAGPHHHHHHVHHHHLLHKLHIPVGFAPQDHREEDIEDAEIIQPHQAHITEGHVQKRPAINRGIAVNIAFRIAALDLDCEGYMYILTRTGNHSCGHPIIPTRARGSEWREFRDDMAVRFGWGSVLAASWLHSYNWACQVLTIEVDRILVGIDTQTNMVDTAKAAVGIEGTTQEGHTCCKVNPSGMTTVPPNPAKAVNSMTAPEPPRALPSKGPSTAPPSAEPGTPAGPGLTAVLSAPSGLRVSVGLSAPSGPSTPPKPSASHNAKNIPSPGQYVLTRTGIDGKPRIFTGEVKIMAPSSDTVKNPSGDEASTPEHEKAMREATESSPIGTSKSPGKNNKVCLNACTRPRKTLPRQVTTVDPAKKTTDPFTTAGSSITSSSSSSSFSPSSSGPSTSVAADHRPSISSADVHPGSKKSLSCPIADTKPKKSAPINIASASVSADIKAEINTTTTTTNTATTTTTTPPPPATKRKPRHRKRKAKPSVEHPTSAAPAAATVTKTIPTEESKMAKPEKSTMEGGPPMMMMMMMEQDSEEAESETTPSITTTHAPFCMIDKSSDEYLCGSF